MDRRSFIAVAGLAALGGCAAIGGNGNPTPTASPPPTTAESDPAGTETGTTASPDERTFLRSNAGVVDLETVTRTYALSPASYRTPDGGSIRMRFTATATSRHPATVAATLENGNDFENTFRTRWIPPFGDPTSRPPDPFGPEPSGDYTYRETLVFAPTPNHDLVDDPPQVRRGSDGTWRVADVSPWQPERVRLGPGESIEAEFYVVGRTEGAESGRPTGSYEFPGRHDAGFRVAVWNTDSPGPGKPSRFESASVPSLSARQQDPGSDEPRTAWYHEADGSTKTTLVPSRERATLPAQVSFTFVNKSRESVGCGHWNLYKLDDGDWFHVAPFFHTADCRVLWPGAEKTWTLNAYHGEALPAIGDGGDGRSVGFLGGGRYAVATGYAREAGETAALVELGGEAVSIVPTDDVTSERDGETVRVRSPERREEGTTPVRIVLSSGSNPEYRLIPEQVMRGHYRGLRNTLAFFEEGVTRVVLETSERVAERVVGYENPTARFAFEGDVYRVRMESVESSD